MATMRTSIALYDGVTSPLMAMNRAMNLVLSSFESMESASGRAIDTASIKAAREELNRAEIELNSIEAATNRVNKAQKQYNSTVSAGTGIWRTLSSLAGAYFGVHGVQNLVSLSDQNVSASARLSLLVGGDEAALDTLESQIMAMANKSRASYLSTAEAVARIGLQAGNAFGDTSKLLTFVDTLNKSYVIAGASTQEADAATRQLTQAMASGVLRGEELNSVMEQAPMIAEAIADYLEVDKGQIRTLAAEGQITADVVKGALIGASEDINAQFESMPMTWGQVWNQFQNFALKAMQPILDGINWLANNVDAAVQWITDNLDLVVAVLAGIAAAAAVAGAQMVGSAINSALAWAGTHWYLFAIVAAISAVIFAARKMGATWEEIGGVVGTVLGHMYASVMNVFLVPAQRQFAAFANFVGNFLKNPVGAVIILFQDMALTVLGYIRNVAHGMEDLINKIPGFQVNLTSGIDAIYKQVEDAAQKSKDAMDWEEFVKPWDYVDYLDAWNQGAEIGGNLGSMLDNFSLEEAISGLGFDLGGVQNTLDGILDDTGTISDATELSQEDLKYLRDIANREAINRFTTAQIKIDQRNENYIGSDMDVDGIMNRWTEGLVREMNISAEGVHV